MLARERFNEPTATAHPSDAGDDPHARGAGIAGYLFPASKPSSQALELSSLRIFF